MFKRLRRGFFLGVALLFILCLGFTTPALAEGEPTYVPSNAMLTAVIVAPVGTDATGDEYVFHFDGDGEVTGQKDANEILHVYSDNIEQDNTTIKPGDVVPTINDVTLNGTKLVTANSLINGDLGQTVVQKPLSEILNGVEFPHAGIYTYEVTQTSARSDSGTAYVAASKAKYCLRIWVKNAKTGNQSVSGGNDLAIDYVTVQRLLKDDGDVEKDVDGKPVYEKVNPTNPTANASGKIETQSSGLAGDASGRNVPGFTFANDYITIAPLKVKKLYDGNHADRTRYSTVELAVHSSVNPNTSGGALTYVIEGGGADLTTGSTTYDDQVKKVSFNNEGWCYITENLKEGSSIRITGELDSNGTVLSTNGLFRGQTYYVLENNPGDYRPDGYVYRGSDSYEDGDGKIVFIDPRKHYEEGQAAWYKAPQVSDSPQTVTDKKLEGASIYGIEHGLNGFALLLINEATGNDTTIFVVNNLDDNKVSPTGIFIDNLPYILMIGVPLVVFAGMFIAKRRGNAA